MTRAEAVIDLAAVRSNLAVFEAAVGGPQVMAVVKADAYGHGMARIAQEARSIGIPWLGVALLSEARALRQSGDTGRLLAWLWAPGDPDLESCVTSDVDISVSSLWALAEVAEHAQRVGVRARVHLKVDTGLSRNGASVDDWAGLVSAAREAQDAGAIEVVGVWSHLANADLPGDSSVDDQRAQFEAASAVAIDSGLDPEVRHLANTAAALGYPDTRYDLVRLGIGMYGVPPSTPGSAAALGLTSVMTLRSRLALVKTIPAGQSVSYGSSWTAQRATRVGLVPLGYADGVPRSASGRGEVLLDGVRCPVIGRIAMDQFVIAIDDRIGHARAGDEVVVFGDEASGAPTADDWAVASDSIGYEIVTRVSGRVPRRYVGAP
ncbi:MAG: alanine racemase [Actinobacteria bacterium]|nr:alanine racemase [Actinomycetota bacterium]